MATAAIVIALTPSSGWMPAWLARPWISMASR